MEDLSELLHVLTFRFGIIAWKLSSSKAYLAIRVDESSGEGRVCTASERRWMKPADEALYKRIFMQEQCFQALLFCSYAMRKKTTGHTISLKASAQLSTAHVAARYILRAYQSYIDCVFCAAMVIDNYS